MNEHTAENDTARYHVFRRWQSREKGYTWPPEYGPWHLIASTRASSQVAVCGAIAYTRRGVRKSAERPDDRLCPKCKAHDDASISPEASR